MSEVAEKKRNVSIELLRVTAMAMVLYMHTVDIAVYDWSFGMEYHLNLMSFPEVVLMLFSVMAVNVFAMISGYLLCRSEFKLSRLLSIYLHTAFYTIGITALFALFSPRVVSLKTWGSAFIAVYSYWYVKSYFAVICFMPLLVAVVDFFRTRMRSACILLLFVAAISTFLPGDMFCVSKGYSFVWLSILFVVGGLIRDLEDRKSLQSVPNSYFALVAAGCLLANVLCYYCIRGIIGGPLQKKVLFSLFSYCGPFVLIQSVCFFIYILRFRIENAAIRKAVLWSGPLSFTVYLIHLNPLFRYNIFKGSFGRFLPFWQEILSDRRYAVIYLLELSAVLFVFVSCCLVDLLRVKLFTFCHIPQLLKTLDRLVPAKLVHDRKETGECESLKADGENV